MPKPAKLICHNCEEKEKKDSIYVQMNDGNLICNKCIITAMAIIFKKLAEHTKI